METTYLTAEKARQFAKSQNELECILDEVFRRALKGWQRISLKDEISPDTIAQLQQLGYGVRDIKHRLCDYLYCITW